MYTLSFFAGNVYTSVSSSLFDEAAAPETLMSLSVYFNERLVFGPFIPPPLPLNQAGNYFITLETALNAAKSSTWESCTILSSQDLVDNGVNLTFVAQSSAANRMWSVMLSAIELIPASSNAARSLAQVNGLSNLHSGLAGEYASTDLLLHGHRVFVQYESYKMCSTVYVSCPYAYLLYDVWSGTIMVTSRLAREQQRPPEIFQPLGTSSWQAAMLAAISLPWLEQVRVPVF